MGNKVWSNKEFWSKYWDNEKRPITEFTFSELIKSYIDFTTIDSYMEIGGAPGIITAYINKTYGIKGSVIDYVDKKYTENLLNEYGITNYSVYEEDFTKFDVKKHGKRYGLVASWGFIEHFDKEICCNIIQKQKDLVEDGGYLLIELPNIRKMNWLIYRVFNNSLLKIHNIDIMNLPFLKTEVLRGNEFELLYCNYYLTSLLFANNSNEFYNRHPILKKIFNALHKTAQMFHIDNIKTQFFSPYIVLLAKRI